MLQLRKPKNWKRQLWGSKWDRWVATNIHLDQISYENNKFQSFVMFARIESTNQFLFTRNLRGLYNWPFKQQGKVQKEIKWVSMSDPFGNQLDLHFIVQVFKVLIFSIAHSSIFLLISHIFVVAGQERRWLHWKNNYT